MKQPKQVEIVLQLSLIVMLLLNMLGPSPVKAKNPEQPAKQGEQPPAPNTMPILPPQSYNSNVKPPSSAAAEAAFSKPKLPAQPVKRLLEFHVEAENGAVALNETVTLKVTVRNNSAIIQRGLHFVDTLKNGFVYVPDKTSPVKYDAVSKQVTYDIASLKGGQSLTFSYKVKINTRLQKSTLGEVRLHNASLSTADGQRVTTQVALILGNAGLPKKSSVSRLSAAGGWNQAGFVSVYLSKGDVPTNSVLAVSPIKPNLEIPAAGAKGMQAPSFQFQVKLMRIQPVSAPMEGTVSADAAADMLDENDEIPFDDTAYMTVDLTGIVDLETVPAGKNVYIATLDEESGVWVQVPIVEIDPEANTVTVGTNHFSTWGAGLGDALPQNGAGALLFDQPYTSLFNGAARYSIPVSVPAGRAGMTPSVSLSYSSATVDGVLGDVQAPWVGEGWNMDSTEIVRKITTNTSGYGYTNDFTLALNGAQYPLIQDETHPSRYYVKQNGFLYIQRHNCALDKDINDCTIPGSGDRVVITKNQANQQLAQNNTGEWWEVVTTDGRRYRLGGTLDSEQLALMYGYNCSNGGINCSVPSGAYGASGYAGLGIKLIARRWRVDKVSDTYGNYMTYSYAETQPTDGLTPAFDRESYLEYIHYTGFEDGTAGTANDLDAKYHIHFVRSLRTHDVPDNFYLWDNYDSQQLGEIDICYGTGCSAATLVRKYDFNYSWTGVPNANGTLLLDTLQISGGNSNDNGHTSDGGTVSLPKTASVQVKFAYANKPNRAVAAGQSVFSYPRLTSIDNGYGATLTYTYADDARVSTSWYNYHVTQVVVNSGVVVDSGLDIATKRAYEYTNVKYADLNTLNDGLGTLTGYGTVTEKTLDFKHTDAVLQKTEHTFNTDELDTGNEIQTDTFDGDSSTVLRRTVNNYVTDNSFAPFYGWNYRYLGQVQNCVRIGTVLTLTSKTQYINDPRSGNLLEQLDYNGSDLYRKTYYEYVTNADPSIYILDRVSRIVRTDANNRLYADVFQYYDANVNGGAQTALTHGALVLTRARSGTSNSTMDSATTYNLYGLPVSSRSYANSGTLGTSPSGSYVENSTEYDGILHQFPVKNYDPLNHFTEAVYIYELGAPSKTIDQNGWVSTSTYDGLGRKLSVTPPGLGTAGMLFHYPPVVNARVNAPYSVEMQILDEGKQPAVYRSVWGIYDGLGRIIQNQVFDATLGQNNLLITDTTFNAAGAVEKQGVPQRRGSTGGYYLPPNWASIGKTTTLYDSLGRVILVSPPGQADSKMEYDGLTTRSIDQNNHQVERENDGLGHLLEVREYGSSTTTPYATTRYDYDAADRLLTVTDQLSNVTTLAFNWLGQKIGMNDPDMGIWLYEYDALGGMSKQTDARGCETNLTYDTSMHRLSQKNYSGPGACVSTAAVTYTYDDNGTFGMVGARRSMVDGSGNTQWSYQNYGRTVRETRTIGSGSNSIGPKEFTSTSDWLGRPLQSSDPDGDLLNYAYDALGQAYSLTRGNEPLVSSLSYDALGRLKNTELGNGVTITNIYGSNMRLAQRKAVNLNATLMDFSYEYDNAGNITHTTDNMRNERIDYTYGALNRLLTAQAVSPASGTPVTTIYDQAFGYDKIGNISYVNNNVLPIEVGGMIPGAGHVLASYHPAHLNTDETATATQTATRTSVATNTPQASLTPTKTLSPTKTATATAMISTATPLPTSTLGIGYALHGYWTFNSNTGASVPDASGDNHTGTLNQGAAIVNDSSPYLLLDGSYAYMSIDRNSTLAHTNGFTLMTSLAPNGTPTTSVKLISLDDNTILRLSTGGYLELYTAGLTPSTLAGPRPLADTWQNVAAVYDANAHEVRMYVNGVQVASQTVTGSITASGNTMVLGNMTAGAAYFYNGGMDQVRFYNRPLSSAEITNINGFLTPTVDISRPTSTHTPAFTRTITRTPTKTPTKTATSTATATPYPTGVDSYTRALLHFDGTDGATSFTDETGRSWSAGSGAQIDTSTKKYGTGSLYLPGTADDINTADASAFYFSTGDFTIDFWTRFTTLPGSGGNATFYAQTEDSNNWARLFLSNNGSGTNYWIFRVYDAGTRIIDVQKTTTIAAGSWHHIALVRDGSNFMIFEDGIKIGGTTVDSDAIPDLSGVVRLGTSDGTNWPLSGRVDDYTISKGISRWTGNFTPGATATITLTPTITFTPSKTPTRTPAVTSTPTLLPAASYLSFGTGDDGALYLGPSASFNLNTDSSGARTCADGIAYSVTELYGDTAKLNATPAAGCLSVNDEMLLINLQGTDDASLHTGSYEFLRVKTVSTNTVIFNRAKTYWYGKGASDDNNIGTGTGQQRVMLMRVPNYHSVNISSSTASLTTNTWDGALYGVLALRVDGTLSGPGDILMWLRGYRGDNGSLTNACGESITGFTCGHGGGTAGTYGGGGAYATTGDSTVDNASYAVGGSTYGDASLNKLYFGSAGGRGSGAGGRGGGIVYIAASTINMSVGSLISVNGGPPGTNGGSGAGGSMRIEADAFTGVGGLQAMAGTSSNAVGGSGRIAVYRNTSSAAPVSYPAYNPYSLTTTPTLTPVPTSIDLHDPLYGSGADGQLYIAAGMTVDINTRGNHHDICTDGGDAVSYSVTKLGNTYAKLSVAPAANCLQAGDEFLLINLLGTNADHSNVGNYEFLHVGSVDAAAQTVYFTTAKNYRYGKNTNADDDIGIGANQQRVMLMRVPNYQTASIYGTFQPDAFDGLKGGVLALRVNGVLKGTGIIRAGSLGYRGGAAGSCGESYAGYVASSGGGCGQGGGGHGTAGANGTGAGGQVYGGAALQGNLYMGGGGGSVGSNPGARGAGIVYISAQTIEKGSGNASGLQLAANGGIGVSAGSGAGGSIYVRSGNIDMDTISAVGGSGGTANGGTGRRAVYYDGTFTSPSQNVERLVDVQPSTATPALTPTKTPTLNGSATATATAPKTPTPNGSPTQTTYNYSSSHPHAVESLSTGSTYTYDANGNMLTRHVDSVTYTFVYNGENRVSSVTWGTSNFEIYFYDGDGARVAKLVNTTLTAYFAGGSYEVTGTSVRKYYSLAGTSIMDDNGTLTYLLSDQQGSVVAVAAADGSLLSSQRYLPFGQLRADVNDVTQTDFGYTGQREMSSIGLMDYNARLYDPQLGRFIQPDTMVSNPVDPQTWNRYSYVNNNPINMTDPTGHTPCEGTTGMEHDLCMANQPQADDGSGDDDPRCRINSNGNKVCPQDLQTELPDPKTQAALDALNLYLSFIGMGTSGSGCNTLTLWNGSSWCHDNGYQLNYICAEEFTCSDQLELEYAKHFQYPGQLQGAVTDGAKGFVMGGDLAPNTVLGDLGAVWVNVDGSTMVNSTYATHIFFDGTITRKVANNTIVTTGKGTNNSLLVAAMNQYGGPAAFKINDLAMLSFIAVDQKSDGFLRHLLGYEN